jgi:hypothetical protein
MQCRTCPVQVVSAIGAAEALNFSAPKQIDGEVGT